MPSCLRLLSVSVREAASRTFCTAGISNAMRTAIMAITTRSSISVKPRRVRDMGVTLERKCEDGFVTYPPACRQRGWARTCILLEVCGRTHRFSYGDGAVPNCFPLAFCEV